MAGTDVTIALARLLSDRRLRARFSEHPASVARELTLRPEDAAMVEALDPAAVDAQAQALIDKRRHEVMRLAPRTWALLADSAAPLFDEYASHHWPCGHRRHPQDALSFLSFLSNAGAPCAPLEACSLATRLSDRRFRMRVLRREARWRLPAIYVAWRTANEWHERVLHVGPGGSSGRPELA